MNPSYRLQLAATVLLAATSYSLAQSPVPGAFRDRTELPTEPAAARITALVSAINGGTEAAKRFVSENFTPEFVAEFPLEEHAEIFGRVKEVTGGVEFYSVREYDQPPGPGIVIILKCREPGVWRGVSMRLEDNPPHRISFLNFSAARPPAEAATPAMPLGADEFAAELGKLLEDLSRKERFSGAVLVARGDQVLFRGAYGCANRRYDVPNRIDTKFNLGSMNKMFTAVAVAQLVERGKLSYDDPLSKFIEPDWLPREITDKVRIKHLLTHTAGLGSYFNETYARTSRTRFREVKDYRPLVSGETLAFEPGTQWSYSNTGFLLLGLAIEKASGLNYFDYIRQHVYEPADMRNSVDRPVKNLAIGYSRRGDDWIENTFEHVIRGGPAGGGFSTVEDLFAFAQALRSGKLVKAQTAELLWSPKPDLHSPEYGFGFGCAGAPGDRRVGHSGGFLGISAELMIYLDRGLTVAVLANVDRGAELVAERAAPLLARLK